MKKLLLFVVGLSLITSCSKEYLETENQEYVSQEQLNALAESSPEALLTINGAVLDGTTAFLSEYSTNGGGRHDDFGQKSIDLGLDLMSNDMVQDVYHWFGRYYRYSGRETTSGITDMVWSFYYKIIRNSNSIIAQIPADTNVEALRSVRGRALAMRGFSYFHLVRIYSNNEGTGIPIYTESLSESSRMPKAEVLNLIKNDYEAAYLLLNNYSRTDKQQINQNVLAGLMARFYLETGDYANAILMANQAKDSAPLSADVTDGYDDINLSEVMWGTDINTVNSTVYASYFSHIGNLNPGYAGLLGVYKSIDKRIFDNVSTTDLRNAWKSGTAFGVPQYASTKFIDATFFEGDNLFMRSAEFYLILAEAKALNGDDMGAVQDLYTLISLRDPGYTLSTNTGNALMDEIKFQRSWELWGEGFAYFDMKRWGNSLERDYVGSNHSAYGKFNYPANATEFNFQIPEDELDNNDSITEADQNP